MSLINVSHLTFGYEGGLEKIFENVSFRVDTDWKLGFTGRNGRGKTTFLNLLLGRYDYEGSITSSVAFEYFPYPVPDGEMDAPTLIRTVAPAAADWQIAREVSLLDVTEDALAPTWTASGGSSWCPMTGPFSTGAWTTFCPSTGRTSRSRRGIFRPGGGTGSSRTRPSGRKTIG